MNQTTVLWGYFLFFCLLGLMYLSAISKRSLVLTVWGIAIVFLSPLLARFVSSIMNGGSFIREEDVVLWLFSFRALGLCLFVWGLCEEVGEKIENLIRSLNVKRDGTH